MSTRPLSSPGTCGPASPPAAPPAAAGGAGDRPKLLDLFSGAGGAGAGYALAGFDVTGVDIRPQPRYPFAFVQADALEYAAERGGEYDAIHASPPCQGYSVMRNLPWLRDREYPLLILPTRLLLQGIRKPYVLENVMGARYGSRQLAKRGLAEHGIQGAWLCGLMFGLPFYRHRLFESSWFWPQPGHPRHTRAAVPTYPARKNAADLPEGGGKLFQDAKGSWRRQRAMNGGLAARQQGSGNGAQEAACGVGHAAGWRDWARIAGIAWMTREETCQAIPPVYTQYVGGWLRRALGLPVLPGPAGTD